MRSFLCIYSLKSCSSVLIDAPPDSQLNLEHSNTDDSEKSVLCISQLRAADLCF